MHSEALVICALALGEVVAGWGGHVVSDYQSRLEACEEVAERASDYGVPQSLAVSLGMQESGFVASTRSKVGAIGPLQVMPQHHCPERQAQGCDLVEAGFVALKKYALEYGCGPEVQTRVRAARHQGRRQYLQAVLIDEPFCPNPDWATTLCHYAGGQKCYSKGRGYAKSILKRADSLDKQMRAMLLAR